jgi:hypothetical protein
MIEAVTPLSGLIMQFKIGTKHAAPCFEFYPAGGEPLPMQKLFDQLMEELRKALDCATDEDTRTTIRRILFSLDRIAPPK